MTETDAAPDADDPAGQDLTQPAMSTSELLDGLTRRNAGIISKQLQAALSNLAERTDIAAVMGPDSSLAKVMTNLTATVDAARLTGELVPPAGLASAPASFQLVTPDIDYATIRPVTPSMAALQLRATEGVAEALAEMVRLTGDQKDLLAEQRDIAIEQKNAAEVRERKAVWHSRLAQAGTWVAVAVAIVAIIVGR